MIKQEKPSSSEDSDLSYSDDDPEDFVDNDQKLDFTDDYLPSTLGPLEKDTTSEEPVAGLSNMGDS